MATVPTITQRTVLPNSGGLPYSNPEASIPNNYVNKALVQTGGQIKEAGNILADAFAKIQLEDNKREFRKLDTEYSSYLNTITYGDGTAEHPGFLNQKGENALNAYPIVQKQIQDKLKSLKESASNQQVIDMFSTAANERTNSVNSQFLNHTADERQRANDAVTDARLKQAVNDAASNWANPAALERSIAIVQGDITDAAIRNGLPKEAAVEQSKEVITTVLEKTISAAMIGSTATAKALLVKYANQMDGFTIAALKDKIHAQDMQNLSDAERYERLADKAKQKQYDENVKEYVKAIDLGQMPDSELSNGFTSGDYSRNDLSWLLSYKHRNDTVQAKSDPTALLDTSIGIREGTITDYNDIRNNNHLSIDDREKYISLLNDKIDNDPILSRADVKQGTEYIKITLGPQPGLEAQFDDEQKQRYANALEEYQNKAKANPNQNMQKLYHDVVDSYRPTQQSLNALPRPKFISPNWPAGDKATMLQQLKEAYIATGDELNNGNISKEDALKQLNMINGYLDQVNRILEPNIQVQP